MEKVKFSRWKLDTFDCGNANELQTHAVISLLIYSKAFHFELLTTIYSFNCLLHEILTVINVESADVTLQHEKFSSR
ncbi:CLUMA_CG021629, isoform A [Clunio marinus]|uniref:CLUMA_CG021629, isoform A n=1 Tax=Clunio marinus TaxID=568069 RepID=A0A1J1J8H3_9DIPT|nr:CLUMA_CG021629, isoform A [Clunio marinus]